MPTSEENGAHKMHFQALSCNSPYMSLGFPNLEKLIFQDRFETGSCVF